MHDRIAEAEQKSCVTATSGESCVTVVSWYPLPCRGIGRGIMVEWKAVNACRYSSARILFGEARISFISDAVSGEDR